MRQGLVLISPWAQYYVGKGRITSTALAVGRGRKRQRAQTLCVYLGAVKEQAVKTDEMR